MTTQFKKGILELCILKVISDKEMYGFEVINKLADLLDVNENTIYPILRRLTNQQLFTTYEKDSEFGAKRKYYRITNLGLKTLTKSLDEWQKFTENVNIIMEGKYEQI